MDDQDPMGDDIIHKKRLDDILAQIKQRLENASDSQEKLSKARNDLLVKRERVRTTSRKVQLVRVDAGDAEATFMSKLREFVNKHRDDLPLTILDAHDTVERKRSDLGVIEENYLQAERDLSGAEWTFMDKENAFYQFELHNILLEEEIEKLCLSNHTRPEESLHTHPPPPSSPSPFIPTFQNCSTALEVSQQPPHPSQSFSPASFIASHILKEPALCAGPRQNYFDIVTEVDSLRRDFNILRQQQLPHVIRDDGDEIEFINNIGSNSEQYVGEAGDIVHLPFTKEYFGILERLSSCEVKAQQLKMEEMGQCLPVSILTRRVSHPTDLSACGPAYPVPMKRAHTESDAPRMRDNALTKAKIREWSLNYLKDNVVEKRLYINTLEYHGVMATENNWEERATQYWGHDSPIGSGMEAEDDAIPTSGTSHEANSHDDVCVAQEEPFSLLSLQDLPGRENCSLERSNTTSQVLEEIVALLDDPTKVQLPPSPTISSEVAGERRIGVPSLVLTSAEQVDQEESKKAGSAMLCDEASAQALGGMGSADLSRRKDSCQSLEKVHDEILRCANDFCDSINHEQHSPPEYEDKTAIGGIATSEHHEKFQQIDFSHTLTSFDPLENDDPSQKFIESTAQSGSPGCSSQSSIARPSFERSSDSSRLHKIRTGTSMTSRRNSGHSEILISRWKGLCMAFSQPNHLRSKSDSFIVGHASARNR